ncbi:MAG: KEOPS complex subunit Pcc1 [Nitrososphaerales archaeon]
MSYKSTPFIKNIEIEIFIELDKSYLKNIYQALMPELDKKHFTLGIKDDKLWLLIKGNNISQIRAAINSYLRLIKVAIEVLFITTHKIDLNNKL